MTTPSTCPRCGDSEPDTHVCPVLLAARQLGRKGGQARSPAKTAAARANAALRHHHRAAVVRGISGSRCDECAETVLDVDAGFSPGLHEMAHDCGGTWRAWQGTLEECECGATRTVTGTTRARWIART